jgi:hypothetical protein
MKLETSDKIKVETPVKVSSPNVTRDGIEVKVGQRWQDQDKRMKGRVIKVSAVSDGFAHYSGPASKGKIAIRRMHQHSTGFVLMVEKLGEGPATPAAVLHNYKHALKEKLEAIRALVDEGMVRNGDTSETCQRMCVLNGLYALERAVAGITEQDMEPSALVVFGRG